MIEQATAFATNAHDDAGYKSWQTSMRKVVMRLDPSGRTAGPVPTFGSMVHETAMATNGLGNAYAPAAASSSDPKTPDIAYDNENESNEYTFNDLLDIINPLQHLPVIGTIYRQMSGDTMKGMSSILGGALFGGPIGAVASTANVIVHDRTGKDIAENAMAYAGFDAGPAAPVKNNDIVYAETNNVKTENLVAANLYERVANDGRKNFSASKFAQYSWNA